jgi:putative MATE family efflux protein
MENDLTKGSVFRNLIRFSLPYLLSCFLQTFYGLADLFIAGQFNGADTITAVSMGSQVTHMLTLIVSGLAMGGTVSISRAVGAGNRQMKDKAIANTVILFAGVALFLTVVLLAATSPILNILSTPEEAFREARMYLMICFAGVPFITAYNVISSIFRGLGDSKSPMYFVAIAGVINVLLDYLLIGPGQMGAAGAALATVIAQAASVVFALFAVTKRRSGITLKKTDFRPDRTVLGAILRVGVPVAVQDGFVQIGFLVITVIANRRGVDVAAAVGIVEKIISFLFLVPSAMLSTVSAIAAQNAGAGLHRRSRRALLYGTAIAVTAGLIFFVAFQFCAEPVVTLFAKDEPAVIAYGTQYLHSYVLDCVFAGIHFCFSGYFCAYEKSMISFAHNLASILLVRIPGAYLASVYYPDNLFPMGLAAPMGSLLSAIICIIVFLVLFNKKRDDELLKQSI